MKKSADSDKSDSNFALAERCGILENYEANLCLGQTYLDNGDYQRAKSFYEDLANSQPDNPEPYVGLGTIDLQLEKLDNAEISFRIAARLDKNCSRAYCGLAMVAHKKDDYQKAFDLYLKCLDLDTDNLTALLGLFQASCQMGSFAKVIYYLQMYLDMHPEDTAVMLSLAALYVKDEKLIEAKKILMNIIMIEPENDEALKFLEEVEHDMDKINAVRSNPFSGLKACV